MFILTINILSSHTCYAWGYTICSLCVGVYMYLTCLPYPSLPLGLGHANANEYRYYNL
jgi:hypothetical protein